MTDATKSTKLDIVRNADGSAQGDFVHQGQVMAKAQGFSCVSRLWYDKTKPVSFGIEEMKKQAVNREDIRCVAHDMKPIINGVGEVCLEYKDGRQFRPTEHSWRQIANNFGAIPQTTINWFIAENVNNFGFSYKHNEQANNVLLELLKYGHERMKVKGKDSRFLFRTYNDGTLRALLTADYAIIDNCWYMETIQSIFKAIGGDEPRLSHWKGDADTIYGNVLIPDTCREEKDSDYGGMISVGNCEIGTRPMVNMPSVFRAICQNGCVHSQTKGQEIRQVHRGKIDYTELRKKIAKNINDQIPLLKEGITRFLQTKDMVFDPKIVRRANVFAAISNEFKLPVKMSHEMIHQFKLHESGNDNLFGVINSLTRAGQVGTTPKMWLEMDCIAGEMMNFNKNKWERIISNAKSYTSEEVNDILKLA